MSPAASKNVSGAILRRHFVVQHAGELKVVDNQKILQIEYHIFSGIEKSKIQISQKQHCVYPRRFHGSCDLTEVSRTVYEAERKFFQNRSQI